MENEKLLQRVARLERSGRINRILSTVAVVAAFSVGQFPALWANGLGPKSFSA